LPAAGLTCQCIFIVCLRKEELQSELMAPPLPRTA
jgi:hypothetical protein